VNATRRITAGQGSPTLHSALRPARTFLVTFSKLLSSGASLLDRFRLSENRRRREEINVPFFSFLYRTTLVLSLSLSFSISNEALVLRMQIRPRERPCAVYNIVIRRRADFMAVVSALRAVPVDDVVV